MPFRMFTADGREKTAQALDGMPIGSITEFAGAAAPPGFLLCDGALVRRDGYPDLFAAIGTAWGAGDGVTTFGLPDLRGRAPIGAGGGAGLTARALGASGGAETHPLSTAEMPVHNHGFTNGNSRAVTDGGSGAGTISYGVAGGSTFGFIGSAIASQGSGGSHNNMQPWAAVNYIIRALPIAAPARFAPAVVTSLPAVPYDGQEVYFLADAAAGTVWHLRYRAAQASAFKWECVGGGELFAGFSSGGYAAASYGGFTFIPGTATSVVLPLAGVYEFDFGASGQMDSAGGIDFYVALHNQLNVQLTASNDVWARATVQFFKAALAGRARVQVAAAEQVDVRGRLNRGAAETWTYYRAFVTARPLRVG